MIPGHLVLFMSTAVKWTYCPNKWPLCVTITHPWRFDSHKVSHFSVKVELLNSSIADHVLTWEMTFHSMAATATHQKSVRLWCYSYQPITSLRAVANKFLLQHCNLSSHICQYNIIMKATNHTSYVRMWLYYMFTCSGSQCLMFVYTGSTQSF